MKKCAEQREVYVFALLPDEANDDLPKLTYRGRFIPVSNVAQLRTSALATRQGCMYQDSQTSSV